MLEHETILMAADVQRWQREGGAMYATDGDSRGGMHGGWQSPPGTDCCCFPQASARKHAFDHQTQSERRPCAAWLLMGPMCVDSVMDQRPNSCSRLLRACCP